MPQDIITACIVMQLKGFLKAMIHERLLITVTSLQISGVNRHNALTHGKNGKAQP